MNNNDVLRSLRFALDISESSVAQIMKLAGVSTDKAAIIGMMKKEDEPGFVECDDQLLCAFLDGLIIHRRGPSPAGQAQQPGTVLRPDNNLILRKLRIAFEMKDSDMVAIMDLAGFRASEAEVNALFRKPDHKNYRPCGDQFLRNFLKGLSIRLRSISPSQ